MMSVGSCVSYRAHAPPWRFVLLICPYLQFAQYGRTELTTAHGSVGRRVVSFEGYSNNAELELYRYVMQHLDTLCTNYPRHVTHRLAEIINPLRRQVASEMAASAPTEL
eukprot:73134-Pleurochrysis_carterae.AAC.1